MKKLNLFIIASAVVLGAELRTYAGDYISPKADAQRPRVVSGVQHDRDLVAEARNASVSPRAQANLNRTIASGAARESDTLAGVRSSTLSPKAQDLAGDRTRTFTLAPLGSKSK